MTVNGVSCKKNIDGCGDVDREVNAAMQQSLARSGEKPAAKNVTPNGPGWDETKKAQGMGTRRLIENLDVAGMAGKPPKSMVDWITKGVEVTTKLHKAAVDTAKALGRELHEANLRDAQNVVILRMAAATLPKEYVKAELDARSRSKDHAAKIETTLQARPPAEYLALVKSVQRSAQAGIDAAKKLGIDSPEKLDEARKKDAAFAKAYETNTAFRHGVRSRL